VKRIIVVLILFASCNNVNGQNILTHLKEHAIKVDKIDSLSKQVYDLISSFKVIMLREIHGTNEPANLLTGLVTLLTKYGDSVQVGFELPSEQMKLFLKQHTSSSILKTVFFANPSGDGRASKAWFNAITSINKNKMAKIFFFDWNPGDKGNADSIMYLNIKSKIKEHPNKKTITISGGMHNRILPFEKQNKAATFLMLDKDLNIADSLCSLTHEFESGETLWNKFEVNPSIYAKLAFDNYLFLYPKNSNEPYSGIFFTRKLTKSQSAISK
jgi:hypothetical protein